MSSSEVSNTSPAISVRFDDPHADLILRSSDGVDFPVTASIIQLISPFFQAMLSLPQSPGVAITELPIVDMSEDEDTLSLLVRFCYPRSVCDEPSLLTILDIKRAAIVARKYELEFVHSSVQRALIDYCNVTSPLVAYAVAWRFEYGDAIRHAARCTLEVEDFLETAASAEHPPELEEVGATSILHLHRYHSTFRSELGSLLRCELASEYAIDWIRLYEIASITATTMSALGGPCLCDRVTLWICDRSTNATSVTEQWRVCSWWWQYVRNTVAAMSCGRSKLWGNEAFDYSLFHIWGETSQCRHCNAAAIPVLKATSGALRREIERRIKAIPIGV